LSLTLRRVDHDTRYVIQLHEWQPDGEAYPGLPADLDEARERRSARVTVVAQDRPGQVPAQESSTDNRRARLGLTDYCLDRRYR